jgi:hypothetical protein
VQVPVVQVFPLALAKVVSVVVDPVIATLEFPASMTFGPEIAALVAMAYKA